MGRKERKVSMFVLTLVCFLQTFYGSCKITTKKKLTYYDREEQWDTWSSHCAHGLTSGATMVHVDTVMVTDAITHFLATESTWTGAESTWIGLYVSDVATSGFKWQRTCHNLDPVMYQNFVSGIPALGTIDVNTLCVLMDKDTNQWVVASCSSKGFGLCAENIGPCTYEASCFNANNSTVILVNQINQTDCENWCESYVNVSTECWAFTFNTSSFACHIYLTDYPYSFAENVNTCPAEIRAFRRRCFEAHYSDFHPEHVEDINPYPYCAVTSTVSTTTAKTTSTTMSTSTMISSITTTTAKTTATMSATSVFTSSKAESTSTTFLSTTTISTTTATETALITTTLTPKTVATTTSTLTTYITSIATTIVNNSEMCYCPCKLSSPDFHENKTLDELISELKLALILDKKKLSSHIRKYISVKDNRPIAKGLGISVGVGILTSTIFLLIAPDIIKVIRFLHKKFKKIF